MFNVNFREQLSAHCFTVCLPIKALCGARKGSEVRLEWRVVLSFFSAREKNQTFPLKRATSKCVKWALSENLNFSLAALSEPKQRLRGKNFRLLLTRLSRCFPPLPTLKSEARNFLASRFVSTMKKEAMEKMLNCRLSGFALRFFFLSVLGWKLISLRLLHLPPLLLLSGALRYLDKTKRYYMIEY